MLGHINSARATAGLGSLSSHDHLRKMARDWALQMSRDYEAGGEQRDALRHNPSMAGQLPSSYRRAGENVGYTVLSGASHATLVDRLHKAYMNSSGHRANILGEYDRVGVGLVQSDDGTMWSTVVFMLEGQAPEPEPEPQETSSNSGSSGSGGSSGGSSGGDGQQQTTGAAGSGAAQGSPPEPDPEPEPEPPPEPPTTEELFGPDWPEGFLTGDPDAGRALLAGLHDRRRAAWLLPGSYAPASSRMTHVLLDAL